VTHVATSACVGAIRGAKPEEAKRSAAAQANSIRPRYTSGNGQPARVGEASPAVSNHEAASNHERLWRRGFPGVIGDGGSRQNRQEPERPERTSRVAGCDTGQRGTGKHNRPRFDQESDGVVVATNRPTTGERMTPAARMCATTQGDPLGPTSHYGRRDGDATAQFGLPAGHEIGDEAAAESL
jgi:hypothetical protein